MKVMTDVMEVASLQGFRETLLRHARAPLFTGAIAGASHVGECTNPLCGDHVRVTLTERDGRLHELRAQVDGCTMAVASASMMCELLQRTSLVEAEALRLQVVEALASSAHSGWPSNLSTLVALSRLRVSPTRVPCALMAWFAFKQAAASEAIISAR